MRRVWAAIAGSILLWTTCVVALSASAHEEHADWFKWREPEENSDVSGAKVTLRAKVTFQEGVKRWMLEVLPPDGYATVTSWGTVCESGEKDKKQKTVEITCEWNSSAYPDGKPSRNHAYRARVTAWNDDGSSGSEGGGGAEDGGEVKARAAKDEPTTSSSSSTTSTTDTTTTTGEEDTSSSSSSSSSSSTSSTSSTSSSSSTSSTSSTTTTTTKGAAPGGEAHEGPVRTLIVANPPSPPEGVRLAYNKKASEATVAWDANPEPDIAHYLVEERFGDGEWSLVARTTATSWKTRLDEKGTYRFRVAAVRYVGSKERTKEGPRRQPQSGMRQVEADPRKDSPESDQPEPESAAGKRKDQEEGKKNDPVVESTTTTAPPDSVIVNFDGAGDPASTSTTGATGTALAPGLSPIQAGAPGSVQTRYADPPRLPAPVSPEQAYDPGFSLALPYPKEVRLDIVPPPPPAPRLLGTVVLFDSNEEQRRALVGVLAGGLVMFIVGMQAAYLNRRPRPIDLAASTDWD